MNYEHSEHLGIEPVTIVSGLIALGTAIYKVANKQKQVEIAQKAAEEAAISDYYSIKIGMKTQGVRADTAAIEAQAQEQQNQQKNILISSGAFVGVAALSALALILSNK